MKRARAVLSLAAFFCGCGSSSVSIPPGASADPTSPPAADASSTDPTAAANDAGLPPDSTPSPTAGCGTTKPATGAQRKTITVGGKARRYQLVVPSGYDAQKPTRLVFMFHGLGGDGDQIRAYLSLESVAAGQALFVYPDGLPQSTVGGATAWAEDDLAFFDAMVAETSSTYCIDKRRIFAAGHSFGGYMTNLVGCERGDVVRGIAPVSGGFVAAGACKGPVAAWIAHGNADPTVAQSEGITARDRWAAADGCKATSTPVSPSPCVRYDGCKTGYPVEWCSFTGGHYPLPAFTQQAIWDFMTAL